MRVSRAVTFVVLMTFVSSFGLPWLGGRHQFNDDPHWAVGLGTGTDTETAWISLSSEADDDHCLVCHLQRTLRTAARPSETRVVRILQLEISPVSPVAATQAGIARPPGARGPPASFL